jgi:hypothetical protein
MGLHGIEGKDFEALPFAYLGRLHFGWAACVLEPMIRTASTQDAYSKIDRMLHCIQIAHVLLGTCEAFEKLFQQEIISQVDSHVKGLASKRTAREYNRLRTLALAVVSLTDYNLISMDNEDQAYFSFWEKNARLADRRHRIQEQCELLHNVQETETIREESRREWWLSCIVLFLTAFTFISVVLDSYNFIEYKEGWWQLWKNRITVLIVIFIIIIFINAIILTRLRRLTHRV